MSCNECIRYSPHPPYTLSQRQLPGFRWPFESHKLFVKEVLSLFLLHIILLVDFVMLCLAVLVSPHNSLFRHPFLNGTAFPKRSLYTLGSCQATDTHFANSDAYTHAVTTVQSRAWQAAIVRCFQACKKMQMYGLRPVLLQYGPYASWTRASLRLKMSSRAFGFPSC